jgi:hypothetical protein
MEQTKKITTMQDRQKIFRNLVAGVSLGKAAVVGAGLTLAFVGYVDLAAHVLPNQMIEMIVGEVSIEQAAGVGGVFGLVFSLIAGLLR